MVHEVPCADLRLKRDQCKNAAPSGGVACVGVGMNKDVTITHYGVRNFPER